MRQLVGIIIIILVIIGVWALINSAGNQDAERYADVARAWIENDSPTYNFDGSDLELVRSEKIDTNTYQYTFEFESSQAGYGDRSDEMSAQVITPHSVVVRIESGQVVSVITDGVYDEMTGELTSAPGTSGNGSQNGSQTVQLFFYDEAADTDETGNILCSSDSVLPVSRTINDYTIEKHIEAVLNGPNATEEDSGFSSEYPLDGFELEGAELAEDGTLTLSFSDPNNSTTGGSCRVGLLYAQIVKTAESITGVESVVIEPETLFQP